MVKRPAPLKSSLAGSSPVTAAPAKPAETPAEATAPARTTASKPASVPVFKKKAAKTKVAYYQDAEDAERVRGGFQQVGHLEGYQTFSDFHAAVVMREIERLEAKYNDGKPFQGAAPRTGRLGRPLE
ncbi:hypothetical protein GCM10009715_42040 [Paeniglutamicibacter psychrophenolicus]|uniref:ParB-like C-terminal domain-containing protein n=1 Tax=Paeniglutamicibacter psychrophenolicus TaxID=257454 RepID=A0ABS4WJZ2_9MICC|nr:hypothetical protein [Paeniglutamicibacter psychrophenolicus]MBP2376458.1 hypothetical protein [Paeniglutamicibacter psychrophenolicus]